MKRNGKIVCLTASANIIFERTERQRHLRRLLNVEEPERRISELLERRASHYAKADFTIDTSALTSEEVVEKIVDICEK